MVQSAQALKGWGNARCLRASHGLGVWLAVAACGGSAPPHVPASAAAKASAPAAPAAPDPARRAAAVAAAAPASAPVLVAPDAGASSAPPSTDEASHAIADILALDAAHSTSLGAPDRGELRGGVALPRSGPGFRHNPRRPDEARYGTVELIQAIVRAADVVERELPGSGLVVNDIGLSHGGPIHQHGSHQNGRDADILYYALDRERAPMPAVGVPLEPDGTGWDFKDLSMPGDDVLVRLDAPRTWRFVQALLEVAGDDVQRIFMVEHVRRMLLAEAKRAKAPASIRERFELVACQPGTPHDDHMHLRLYCAPDDIAEGCADKAPLYPWHREALAALGLETLRAKPVTRAERRARAKRTTTPAQARRRAGPMHRKVRDFLERRRAWLSKPSPGRPYCR